MSAHPQSQSQRLVARVARVGGGVALLGHAQVSLAAESTPLTQGGDVVTGAGIARVVVAFVIVVALGIAAIALLRRVLPRFSGAPLAGGVVRVVERASLGPTTRVHLVQVDGERVLVAENRTGLTMVVLARAGTPSQP